MSYQNEVFKISFTGIMFSFVILFQYLEKFMPLNMGFINLNISLIFILITNYIAGIKYTIILFILRFLIGPGLGKTGYSDVGFWAHFILLTYDFLFFILFLNFYKLTKKIFLSIVISIFTIAVVAGILNGLLFTPVYWAIATDEYGFPINQQKTLETYQYTKDIMFFAIPNYWLGIFTVYFLGNFIKFSIVGCILYFLLKIIIKNPQIFYNFNNYEKLFKSSKKSSRRRKN